MRELNVVIFGASRSGKTKLIQRYLQQTYDDFYVPTIEELYRKETRVDGRSVSLNILDTQGIEQFKAMRDTYISNGNAFIIVYDTRDTGSLTELEDIIDRIAESKPPSIPVVVAGTKFDKHHSREPSLDAVKQATRLASIFGKPHLTTSAQTNRQVDLVFESLIRQHMKHELLESYQADGSSSTASSISIDGWLHTQHAREASLGSATSNGIAAGAGAQERRQPTLKKSMLKIKRSMVKIRGSKSMRNVRKALSTATLTKPFGSSSHSGLHSSKSGYYGRKADPSTLAHSCGVRARPDQENQQQQQQQQQPQSSSSLRDLDGFEIDAGELDTINQSQLSERPAITDVSGTPNTYESKKGGVCILM